VASEDKLRMDQERGAKAKALLNNELLQEAFSSIEKALLSEWRQTAPDDNQRREDAWRSLKLLENLQSSLKRTVLTGEHSSKELLKMKNPSIFNR
jgi:hypothetical protein